MPDRPSYRSSGTRWRKRWNGSRRLPGAARQPRMPRAPSRSRFAIGGNFFFEIAKLRAARMLWAESRGELRVLATRGEDDGSRTHVAVEQDRYDAYNNVLRGTTEAMSAVIGGCDSLAVTPFDEVYREPDENSRRLARNTQLILKHESWFDRTVDPAGARITSRC